MRVQSGFVEPQEFTPSSYNVKPSFSKDAEIAAKFIEVATNNLNLGETFSSRRITDLTAPGLALARTSNRTGNHPDKDFDGHFVGANGMTFPPEMPLGEIPTVTPQGGVTNSETLIYVNGINTDKNRQASSLQAIADATGSRTIGIHNATQGGLLDVAQSLGDKLDVGSNPAVDTLAETVYNEIRAGHSVHLLAHSQGAIITSRALQDVHNRLRLEDGLSRQEAENLLSNVKVETFGGASRRYPNGPKYVHYVNRRDMVPQLFGLREFLNPFADEGRDAVTHHFSAGSGILAHGLEDIYLNERVPFEQARNGNFNR
jgi:hypothetical protein